VTVAAQAEIDFIAAVHLGDDLVAEAVERARFGRSGIYDITVTRGDEVVAEFRGRSRTIR
jgi:acyl-CoA thioesterase